MKLQSQCDSIQEEQDFKAIAQFRISLAEVCKGRLDNRIFNQTNKAIPNAAYLKRKRSSVFHRAFDPSG